MYTYELPSGIEIELKEMTGAEEEVLTIDINLFFYPFSGCLVRAVLKSSFFKCDVFKLHASAENPGNVALAK
jgi:hypothetical protein